MVAFYMRNNHKIPLDNKTAASRTLTGDRPMEDLPYR